MDVLQTDSDWESSSDSGSSEDAGELEFSYGGQACSILSSLEESIGKIDDFLSFERGFMHGDIVCSITDPSGQMGRIASVKKYVDLENFQGKIMKDVDSEKLLKIRSISAGDYVVHGPWIGRVDKVVDSLTILFDDGTECEITAVDQEKLLPVSPNLLEDPLYPYYPGQRVQVTLSAPSKSARWLCGTSKESLDIGTVFAVKAGLVYADWFACALGGCDLSLPAPSRLQDAENLTLLSCYSHENWHLGDWCILPMADDCKGAKKQMFPDEPDLEFFKVDKIRTGIKKQNCHSELQDVYVIVKTKTVVDVVWQDGGFSLGLDPQTLLPVNVVNAYEFWPGQFVLERSTFEDSLISGNQRFGVVGIMDAKERTVKVKWKSIGVNQENDTRSDQMEEIVSAYELVEHPDFCYCLGDIVFKNVYQNEKRCTNMESDVGEDVIPQGNGLNKDQIDFSKAFLSCIGHVMGFNDDAVEVTWASGLKTKVPPNVIVRIDKYEGSTETSFLHEQGADELNQEMEDMLNSNGLAREPTNHPWESGSFFLPQSTLGFFTRIAASIFGSAGSTSLSGQLSSSRVTEYGNQCMISEEEAMLETLDLCTEMQPLVTYERDRFEKKNSVQEVGDIRENKRIQSSSNNESTERFRQFDMVSDCSDHLFHHGMGKGSALPQVKGSWLKKVQQEWSILEKDLPESIYVRVYEESMDLLRAAIVGAPGTPYHEGLFIFDIYLPPEYPHEPPLVHYHSGGFRVNPNLYECGKVCLSLLNTWTGTETEVWNSNSSIFQVLLSLQALVLNEKPYFNEAGFEKQMGKAEGEKNSMTYNENAFLVTWKSMLYLLRRPPKHFEALLEEHLRRRSRYILWACKAYMEGAPVPYPFEHGPTELKYQKGSSTGFQIMIAKLFPKLVEAFSGKGIDCSQFIQ